MMRKDYPKGWRNADYNAAQLPFILPLRRLIVAVDPLSDTNPSRILRRWESFMNISIWVDDFFFNRFHRSSILRSAAMNETSTILINVHRQRQKMFYFQCMRTLKDEGQRWTAFVDTDELVFQNENDLGFKKVLSLSTNETVSRLLHVLQELNQISSPCVGLPRLLFGANEDKKEDPEVVAKGSLLPEIGFSSTDFMTLRWRWHAGNDNILNRAGKALIDLSRIPDGLLLLDNVNAHRPIKQLCTNDAMWIRIDKSPLVLHHYVGTYEQWISRDDVRNKRTSLLYSAMAAVNSTKVSNENLWLKDFIQAIGENNAAMLLKDVGKVESPKKRGRISPEAKLAKLSSLLYVKNSRKFILP
ncbi:unnamed protein product [Cylindrotheca closterium]|uniref:Uncharacterized protein n=1 Tax=Cylindrotheca closterium TaxID=2856 RepID=A0AAD2CRG2_9STRA|nr:unnamed protein product [Cylindrotheca closterium]